MSPTILVIGATGNTGKSVVKTLSDSIKSSKGFANHRILALTRTSKGAGAQEIAKLPGVEVAEKAWLEITSDWLQENQVERVFIASHNEASQFAEESTFHLAALKGGVDYVVRISTTAANVRPDCGAYYPRAHWAIEAMLSSPEFAKLKWTSLQPAVFLPMWVSSAVDAIKEFRETGKQSKPLRLMAAENGLCAAVHPDDVGAFAGELLLTDDIRAHNKQRYEINGPEDITGRQIVEMTEKEIGQKIDAKYKDMSFGAEYMENAGTLKPLIRSVIEAAFVNWNGSCVASGTSKEVLELRAPKITAADTIKAMLSG